MLFPILICGPIIGRYAIQDPTSRTWQWVYWAVFIAMVINIVGVYFCYEPPKHPRGVPWKTALKGLDYVGMLLVTGGVALTLIGIVYTTYRPASSAIVLGPLISGIALCAIFGVWENVSNVPYKLCPPAIFSYHWGMLGKRRRGNQPLTIDRSRVHCALHFRGNHHYVLLCSMSSLT